MNLLQVDQALSSPVAPRAAAADPRGLAPPGGLAETGPSAPQMLPKDAVALSMSPEAFESVRGEVNGTVSALTQRVHAAVPAPEAEVAAALARLESLPATLTPSNSLVVKKDIREVLWVLRQGLEKGPPAGSAPEIRKALEDARGVAFDCIHEQSSFPSSHTTVRPIAQDVPNYEEVTPLLRRGGQVDTEGATWLVAHGTGIEIDLRGPDRDNQWVPATWGPLQRYSIPVEDYHAPTFQQVEEFLHLVDSAKDQAVYVHCKAGIGRTGTMIACWRISHGATADEALESERLFTGYSLHPAQADFVHSFETYWKTHPPTR